MSKRRMNSAAPAPRYVPAAGRRGLSGLYDPLLAATMRERTFRARLIEQVLGESDPSQIHVVDVGTGTGTLAIELARRGAHVTAVDGDDDVLARARAKPGADGVVFEHGMADQLPVPDGAADRVVMSLLLHHLAPAAKIEALLEARRVLRPGGRLHIADWGKPADPVMRACFLGVQILDGFASTREHAQGLLPDRLDAAGFEGTVTHDRLRTVWGLLELISARRVDG